jgi:hypothetical protein
MILRTTYDGGRVFETLIESSGSARGWGGETAVSMVLHLVALAGAVRATEGVLTSGALRIADTTMIFVTHSPSPARAATPEAPSAPPRAPDPLDGVVPPDILPSDIPRLSMSRGTFNPSAVISLSKQAGIPDGIGGTEPRTGMDGVFMSAEVEVAAEVVAQPEPEFPPLLKHAGVRGYVDLDFVIDASGRVEPSSVRVVASTHDAFVIPATEAILAGVYRPARYRGNAVRQLVRQRVSFQGG